MIYGVLILQSYRVCVSTVLRLTKEHTMHEEWLLNNKTECATPKLEQWSPSKYIPFTASLSQSCTESHSITLTCVQYYTFINGFSIFCDHLW